MFCPFCGAVDSRVVDTTNDPTRGEIRRRRECQACGERFTTVERVKRAMPLVIKQGQDGLPARLESFDRQKLQQGIEIACAKRPIPQTAIDRLVDSIEARLHDQSDNSVPSRMIGEMVITGLRELDEIAYIRYAIVFLGLDNLSAVRQEIDRLLTEKSVQQTELIS
jgi:transcriptional repressor NrdR